LFNHRGFIQIQFPDQTRRKIVVERLTKSAGFLPLSTLAVQLVAKIDLLRRDEAARFVRYRIPFKPKWPGRPLRLSKSASMPGLHSLERKA